MNVKDRTMQPELLERAQTIDDTGDLPTVMLDRLLNDLLEETDDEDPERWDGLS